MAGSRDSKSITFQIMTNFRAGKLRAISRRCVGLQQQLPKQSPEGGEELPQKKERAWRGPSCVTEMGLGHLSAAEKLSRTSTTLSLSHLLMSAASLLLATANLGRGGWIMNKSK